MVITNLHADPNLQAMPDQPRDPLGAGRLSGVEGKDPGDSALPTDASALFAPAIGQIEEGIVIADVSGSIQYVNPAFIDLTGVFCTR